MADGDYDLRIRSRTPSPGGGWNSTGVAQQGKSEVVAYVTGTYVDDGIAVGAGDLGLETIDFITFECQSVAGGTETANGAQLHAEYIRSTGKILMYVDVDGGTVATAADAFILRIFASGDSAAAPELL